MTGLARPTPYQVSRPPHQIGSEIPNGRVIELIPGFSSLKQIWFKYGFLAVQSIGDDSFDNFCKCHVLIVKEDYGDLRGDSQVILRVAFDFYEKNCWEWSCRLSGTTNRITIVILGIILAVIWYGMVWFIIINFPSLGRRIQQIVCLKMFKQISY